MMKRNLIIALFVVLGSIFNTCEEELTRVEKKKFKNGNPATVYYYSGEQKKEFLRKVEFYYPSKKIKAIKRYKNGKLEGYSESWHPNGTSWSRTMYKKDRMVGDYFNNFPNGKPKYIGEYVDGNKNGPWIKFNKQGDTVRVEFYEDGIFKRMKVYEDENKVKEK